jgi:predicted aspartyl protease
MLEGRVGNTSGAPYMEARISIPRLNLRGLVSFLVDTGADGTVLMPIDSRKLGVDFTSLRNPVTPEGIGGPANAFTELAVLSFSDRRYIYSYLIPIHIMTPAPHNLRFSSLLGRDILKSGNFVLNMAKKKVTLTPRTWSLRQKI